jgi:hypothetical protein
MNDQEAKENERKNVLRTLERQTKLMENLSKSEKGLSTTIVSLGVVCHVTIPKTRWTGNPREGYLSIQEA